VANEQGLQEGCDPEWANKSHARKWAMAVLSKGEIQVATSLSCGAYKDHRPRENVIETWAARSRHIVTNQADECCSGKGGIHG